MAPKRSASKGKVDDAAVGEVEVHGWKSSKCTDSHLLDLVGKHLLQPCSVIHWRGSVGESFPHEEGKQQIRFFPHEEKTPPRIHANGSLSEVEEDDFQPDSKDGSRHTYSTSTHGPPPRQRQPRPLSPSKQTSSTPLEKVSLTSRSGASGGLFLAALGGERR